MKIMGNDNPVSENIRLRVRIGALERTLAAMAREVDCILQRPGRKGRMPAGNHSGAAVCMECYKDLCYKLKVAKKEIRTLKRKMR